LKNITVSIDDETYRHARIRAAEVGTSVSALVREFLVRLASGSPGETEFDRLRRAQDEAIALIRARHAGFSSSDRLSRDRVHDRDAVR